METVFLLDGKRVPERDVAVSPLGTSVMFGFGVLDRLRAFRGTDGRMRIIGFNQHLERTLASAKHIFGTLPDLRGEWRNWIASAVQASELSEAYIHLGFGKYASPGAMLERSGSAGLGTIVYVREEGPLYGDSLIVSSETRWPRPDGPLTEHKVHGNYAELLLYKDEARTRRIPANPASVEALLFARQSFVPDGSFHGSSLEENPLVAEYGCSNAFSLCDGDLHLPARNVRFFRGITIRIVEKIFATIFPERRVRFDLRRNHLLHGGGCAGTAARDIIPAADVDSVQCAPTPELVKVAELYRALCMGELGHTPLQEIWAPAI